MMYSQDYDEKVFANDKNHWWTDPYEPYLKSTQILLCPSASVKRTTNYNMNDLLMGPLSAPPAGGGVAGDGHALPLQVVNSSMTIFALDGGGNTTPSSGASGPYHSYHSPAPAAGIPFGEEYYQVATRHLEGANCAFFDGHVKWMPQQKIFLKYAGTAVSQTASYYGDKYWDTYKGGFGPSLWYNAP